MLEFVELESDDFAGSGLTPDMVEMEKLILSIPAGKSVALTIPEGRTSRGVCSAAGRAIRRLEREDEFVARTRTLRDGRVVPVVTRKEISK